jgi:methanogenic corrinoid protein MtbC1
VPSRTQGEYLDAVLAVDARRAQQTVDRAIAAGMPVALVYLGVLAPALQELGARWERAEITIGDEHLATAITQGVLATLAPRLPRPAHPGPQHVAVVGCGAGDFHGVGARMVGDFLEAAGFRLLDLGVSAPASAFAGVAAAHGARVVAVSSSRAEHLDAVRDVRKALDQLRDPPLLAVGGLAYAGHADRASAVGADVHAPDPAELVRLLAPLVGSSAA